ncbi:SMP-30/gluconolactonase/LRE family protein [Rhodococcus qingshengii]|uniref:SMP-30/gluconolactonase/LRE family protein n=1 Tax=Rhodococcus qingshengii TaxID=334542 RepID=UPI001455FBA7|nr:SMP-30/gluconolactonase/LRE family protein [Rhodococcus qingshengii]
MKRSDVADVRKVADGLTFLEGPRWHNNALWFSDFYTNRVLRLEEGTAVPQVVCEVPNQPSGLGFDTQGRLLVVSMTDRRVMRLERGELVEHADLSALAQGHCNDMVVMADGSAYVGNHGRCDGPDQQYSPTRLIRIDADGSARAVGAELNFPNGMVVTDDGGTLLVAESLASRISAFTIGAGGDLVDRRVWAALGPVPPVTTFSAAFAGGGLVPDGIALDVEGALWVAVANEGAVRVTPEGEIVQTIEVPGESVFAVALGGPALRTLYLCVAPPLASYNPHEHPRARMLAYEVEVKGVGGPRSQNSANR